MFLNYFHSFNPTVSESAPTVSGDTEARLLLLMLKLSNFSVRAENMLSHHTIRVDQLCMGSKKTTPPN